ncbi:Vacuolar protein sorting-associated protein 41 [Blyttiomyces sp. JEL0837]|nr:Vacuolar protein sorting-associated protein 41 [Blyttiomyces sp. JEL0837]
MASDHSSTWIDSQDTNQGLGPDRVTAVQAGLEVLNAKNAIDPNQAPVVGSNHGPPDENEDSDEEGSEEDEAEADGEGLDVHAQVKGVVEEVGFEREDEVVSDTKKVVEVVREETETEEEEETEEDDTTDEDEDEEEEDDEDDDDESDEESDEEPKLKYQRLAGTLAETLKKDAVSTMAVSDRFLALGTHWGVVHILDLNGNDVKRFECHSATVNEISIDTNGEYVASASDDGRVVVNSLYSVEQSVIKNRRPMKAVALEPDYSRKATRQVVGGGTGEELIMSGKGWFGTKDVVIHSGEGPIYTVKWRMNYIAWANEAFAYIDRPPSSPRADLFRCNLCWKSDDTLLIGWADSVKVGVVRDRSKMDVASGLPSRYVEIVCQFRTDFIISGIAPLNQNIVLLSFMVDLDEHRNVDVLLSDSSASARQKSNPPEIHIVDLNGNHIANDVLSLFGYEHYQYLPARNPAENTFYIVSPKDIVVAKPRDLDDHIEWLVGKARYEEALKAAEGAAGVGYEGRLSVADVVEIGLKYLGSLMTEGKYELAASTTPKILRNDAKLWEQWIYSFSDAKKLDCIRPYIPTKDPELSSAVYEMIVIEAVEGALGRDSGDKDLLEAAVELYTFDRRFDQALICGLRLGVPNILSLVRPHNLFSVLQSNIPLLMNYDSQSALSEDKEQNGVWRSDGEDGFGFRESETEGVAEVIRLVRRAGVAGGVQLLVQNVDRIPLTAVVAELKKKPRFLHIYLDALFRKDPQEGAEFHPLQIELYAEYDPARLLDFLRTSTSYDLQGAFELCEMRDLVPEMVFLLGKMGNNRKALALVIERLGDEKRAIEFAKEQNDADLWEDLLTYSMDKPPFIVGLLENLGSHIDPVKLVKRIPNGLQIPGLRTALIKIMTDYGIQMSLREGCEKILVSDTVELMDQLYKTQRKGAEFSEEEDSLVFFFCHHVFHRNCLTSTITAKTKGTLQVSTSTPPSTSNNNNPTSSSSSSTTSTTQLNHHHSNSNHRIESSVKIIYEKPEAPSLAMTGAGTSLWGLMPPSLSPPPPLPSTPSGMVVAAVNLFSDSAVRRGYGFSSQLEGEGEHSGGSGVRGLVCPICRSASSSTTGGAGGGSGMEMTPKRGVAMKF